MSRLALERMLCQRRQPAKRVGWQSGSRSIWRHRQDQFRRGRRIMMNRVASDLVGPVIVAPENFRGRGSAIYDFKPQAMALLDEVGHRLKTDFEFVDLVRRQRLRVRMS